MLKEYDILSVQPMTEKAFQLACTDLALPGPNQVRLTLYPRVKADVVSRSRSSPYHSTNDRTISALTVNKFAKHSATESW